jgi:hypothetical protein
MHIASENSSTSPKAANRDKSQWREIVTQWQKSNEHPKDFCAKVGINVGTLAHWRGVFKKENKPQENKFIEVKVMPTAQALERCVIECPTGHKIVFTASLEEIKTVFKLLGLII